MTTLKVKLEWRGEIEVTRSAYVTAKTKQMREFGYSHVTEKETDEQIDAVLAKKKFGKGLTIIGKFMEGEVIG